MPTRYFFIPQIVILVAMVCGGCRESVANDVSGRVLHSETSRAMPGAYVLAAYTITAGGIFGHSSTSCVSTRGMYSRADGSFSFASIKGHEVELHVIAPGFKEDIGRRIVLEKRWYGSESITLPDLFLMPSPGGDYPVNYAYICASARFPTDLAANIAYLKLVYGEAKKYGSPELQRTVSRVISRMEEKFDNAVY